MTLENNEIAIPFGAFGDALEDIEILDVMSDEVDGTIVAAESSRSAATTSTATATAASAATPSPHAGVGRVVIALAAADAGSLAGADVMVEELLDALADAQGIAAGLRHGNSHDHPDPGDPGGPGDHVHWAQVDAARGHVATTLDIVICTHHLGLSQRTYVVTLDAPAALLGAVVSAANAVPQGRRKALLTWAGPTTSEPDGSVVTLAAALHAQRFGGRAEVFPGQEWLTEDRPVTDVVNRTAIDEIRSTQGPFAPRAVLRTYGFARPSYADGTLVLTVGHDDPLVVTPWEVRYCRPCCGGLES
jgi:hypothetical protein